MVKGSELEVDEKKCIGCGACVLEYPQLFKFNAQGKSEVIKSGEREDVEIDEVIAECPQDAIQKAK